MRTNYYVNVSLKPEMKDRLRILQARVAKRIERSVSLNETLSRALWALEREEDRREADRHDAARVQ